MNINKGSFLIRGFAILLLTALFSIPVMAQTQFQARVSGSNEVPSVNSHGTGMITVTLTGDHIKVTGHFSGLGSDYKASHIHFGNAGSNGNPVFELKPIIGKDKRSGTYTADKNTFEISQKEIKALQEGRMYINIHSQENVAGELRGQLLPIAHLYIARLSGDTEVPSVQTNAKGSVRVVLNGDQIKVSGMFYGLSSNYIASHIHLGAEGENGKPLFELHPKINGDNRSGSYNEAQNTFKISPSEVADLEKGELYVNIHSSAHSNGELRGQLMEVAGSAIRVQ